MRLLYTGIGKVAQRLFCGLHHHVLLSDRESYFQRQIDRLLLGSIFCCATHVPDQGFAKRLEANIVAGTQSHFLYGGCNHKGGRDVATNADSVNWPLLKAVKQLLHDDVKKRSESKTPGQRLTQLR